MSILENMNIAKRRPRRRTLLWGFKKPDTEAYKEMVADLGLGLEKRLTSKIGLLSGGQRQSVTLLMATLEKPDILFLDEPIGNLDSKTGIEIMKLFRVINTTMNKTIIQVTHSKESAMFGTKLLNIKDGRIVGKIEQLDSLRSQIDNNSQESNKTGVKKVKRRRM